MATPIRELILETMKTKLSGLPEFGGNEAQRANKHLDIDNLPAISLWDGTDSPVDQDQRYGQAVVSTQVGVETLHYASTDYSNLSTQANQILADLITAATGGDRTLGGLVDDVRYTSTTIYYPDNGSDIMGIDVILEIRWRHDLGDPTSNSMG